MNGCIVPLCDSERSRRLPQPEARPVTNIRFYVLNRYDHVTVVQIFVCNSADAIAHTAQLLLAEHKAADAVEAWDGSARVYRTDRSGITTRVFRAQ
jgi:hypothetical protein